MFCPNCGQRNDDNSKRCSRCNYTFDLPSDNIDKYIDTKSDPNAMSIKLSKKAVFIIINIFLILFTGTFLIAGIIFTSLGLTGAYQTYETRNYVETTAYKKSTYDCIYEDDTKLCMAKFNYQVDGTTYEATSSYRSNFEDVTTIYYNPNNPSEYKIITIMEGWEIGLAWGGGLLIFVIIIFVSVNMFIIKSYKKADEKKALNNYTN